MNSKRVSAGTSEDSGLMTTGRGERISSRPPVRSRIEVVRPLASNGRRTPSLVTRRP
ncbi:MAG: hypothetical protein IKJ45_13380 [Kiritimatiellae bacterium]|nr:hypothetical protein [Kiritimatiellia bacterium]